MARLTGKKRYLMFQQLVERDGLRCRRCGAFGGSHKSLKTKKKLILDHIDNNKENNHPSNFQLLCRACNYKKNPRLSDAQPGQMTSPVVQTAEFDKSRIVEPMFRKWLEKRMKAERRVLKDDALNAGAEYSGCSPLTTQRYLNKLISSVGPYWLHYDEEADEIFIDWRGHTFPKPGEELETEA